MFSDSNTSDIHFDNILNTNNDSFGITLASMKGDYILVQGFNELFDFNRSSNENNTWNFISSVNIYTTID